ncbi:hypothetical protein JW721_01140 [Candidatus Micrarchaeota archaeon]|nr:hypothetical protein [Candidatus Micrarchaeota archaeon]
MELDSGLIYSFAIISSIVASGLIAIAYALGQLLQNPRFSVWAKTELFQVAISISLVFIALFLVGLVGLDPDSEFTVSAGWIDTLSGGSIEDVYSRPQIETEFSVFETSEAYLQNLAFFSHRAVRGSRTMMGVTDEFSKYMRTPCTPPLFGCMLGVNGVNARPLSGATALMQASNLLLYTSSAAYLTVLAQIFLLRFIALDSGGLLAIYMPLAIVLRSLPFMRQFGGALLAICITLFLVYPSLLFVESTFWNPYTWIEDEAWDSVDTFVDDLDNTKHAGKYGDLFYRGTASDGAITMGESYSLFEYISRLVSFSFISASFLFTFNILAVSASASFFARMLGTEVDLSRLMQIV